jgi:GT2 family glycosyltransferase
MAVTAPLTVAIATLDRPEGLARALDALLAGTVLPGEILVVDQGQACAADAVVAVRADGPVPLRRLAQGRRGLAAARNLAFAQAVQPIVAVSDDDCVAHAGWVAALAAEFAAPTPPDAVTGRVLPLGPEQPGLYAVSSRTNPTLQDFRGQAPPWLVGTGANFAARREWVARVGGYDERLGAGSRGRAGEDIDLIHRLLRAGAVIRYQPEAVVYHERQRLDRRRASRYGYGHGIGACCGLWLGQGDRGAVKVLGQWLALRGRIARRAALHGQWDALADEGRVLWGSVKGLGYGLAQREGAQ